MTIYIYAMIAGNLYITGVIQSFYLVVMDLMIYYLLMYMIVLNTMYQEDSDVDDFSYGFVSTTSELDLSLDYLDSMLPLMLQLAEIEKTCQLIAKEIETTKRRVNALEYLTIPNLTETIAHIENTLDENERGNVTRLMKVIDILVMEDEFE